MKKLKSYVKNMNLRSKITVSLIFALIVSVAAFVLMLNATADYIEQYFDDVDRWLTITDTKADELQEYITENDLTTDDWDALKDWNRRNNGVYIYIYDTDGTIYESSRNLAAYSYENYRTLKFKDKTVDLSIFYAIDYIYYSIAIIVEIIISVLLFFLIVMRMVRRIVNEIKRLETDVKILEGGSLDHVITVSSNDEIGSLEKSIDDMRIALRGNMEREEELTRANSELVARMAHDLRTPLTSLLLYLDLISKGKYDNNDELDRYISISKDKAERIKFMSDQLFERFLITGEKSDKCEEPAPVKYVLEDPLSAFIMTLEAQGITTVTDIGWPDIVISVSTSYINRILDNIYSNILKYADRSQPVSVKLGSADENTVTLCIGNRIGDRNSSEGGSNIGLENIELMLRTMGGTLTVNDDGTTFELEISLPSANNLEDMLNTD